MELIISGQREVAGLLSRENIKHPLIKFPSATLLLAFDTLLNLEIDLF